MTVEVVAAALSGVVFLYEDEAELQQGVYDVLSACFEGVQREVRLSPTDRVDVLVGSIAVELKVAGRRKDVLRQVARYALRDDITGVVLLTNRRGHMHMPEVEGFEVRVVVIPWT